MIDPSAKKDAPWFANDGDATDAEINRKLTEHLKKHAISVTAGEAPPTQAPSKVMPTARSPLFAVRFFGTMVAQIFGLVAIVSLMVFASIHAYFYEKET